MWRRMSLLRKMMEQLGIEPERLRVVWVSASEGEKFANEVRDFVEKLKSLGPLKMYEPSR